MTYQEMTFESGGVRCSGWHFPGTGDRVRRRFRTPGRGDGPRIRRNQGLRSASRSPSASQAAGLDVLAFDYRGFGASEGIPRQTISIERQIEDYQAAIARGTAPARCRPEPHRAVGIFAVRGTRVAGGRRTRRYRRGDRHDTDDELARDRPAGGQAVRRGDGAPVHREWRAQPDRGGPRQAGGDDAGGEPTR